MTSREWALKVLGVGDGASAEEVNHAYRDLVQVWHPDKYSANDRLRKRAEEEVKRLNRARDILLLASNDGPMGEAPPGRQPDGEPRQPGEPDVQRQEAGESRNGADRVGALLAGMAGALSLLYPLLGNPPYSYFGFMKLLVVASALYVAWTVYRVASHLALLSVILVVLAGVEMFGKMHRNEWVPYNWATVISLVVAGLLLLQRG